MYLRCRLFFGTVYFNLNIYLGYHWNFIVAPKKFISHHQAVFLAKIKIAYQCCIVSIAKLRVTHYTVFHKKTKSLPNSSLLRALHTATNCMKIAQRTQKLLFVNINNYFGFITVNCQFRSYTTSPKCHAVQPILMNIALHLPQISSICDVNDIRNVWFCRQWDSWVYFVHYAWFFPYITLLQQKVSCFYQWLDYWHRRATLVDMKLNYVCARLSANWSFNGSLYVFSLKLIMLERQHWTVLFMFNGITHINDYKTII